MPGSKHSANSSRVREAEAAHLEEFVLKKLRCCWPLVGILDQALGHDVPHCL